MNIKQVFNLIQEADAVDHVPLIESLHGIGKSTICETYAREKNLHFEPLILSLMDIGDLIGIPRTTQVGGQTTTVWAAPDWYSRIVNAAWPTEMPIDRLKFVDTGLYDLVKNLATEMIKREKLNELYCQFYKLPSDELQLLRQENVVYLDAKRSVLFLDEFNRSPSDVLNASLQLILEKRLHTHILPRVGGKDTFIVSAINPSDGDYTVVDFDPALLDRFVQCNLDPDTNAWLSWANDNNVNEVVRDYLTENPSKLHFVPKDGKKGSSPRSWTRLASYLDSINNKPTETTSYYLKGIIGESLAAEFLLFLQGYARSMSVEEIQEIVEKKAKRVKDIEKLGAHVGKAIDKVEAIKKMELAHNLQKAYTDVKDASEALPYLAYLYGLPLENLTAFLTNLKSDNQTAFQQLVAFDGELNSKGLFRKIVTKVAS
jgi:hypothetical protein